MSEKTETTKCIWNICRKMEQAWNNRTSNVRSFQKNKAGKLKMSWSSMPKTDPNVNFLQKQCRSFPNEQKRKLQKVLTRFADKEVLQSLIRKNWVAVFQESKEWNFGKIWNFKPIKRTNINFSKFRCHCLPEEERKKFSNGLRIYAKQPLQTPISQFSKVIGL